MLSKGPFGPFLGAHGLPSTGIQVHNDNSCLMQVVVKVFFFNSVVKVRSIISPPSASVSMALPGPCFCLLNCIPMA